MNLFNVLKVLKGSVLVPNDHSGAQLNILTQEAYCDCDVSANKDSTEFRLHPPLLTEHSKTMGSCADTFQIQYHCLI